MKNKFSRRISFIMTLTMIAVMFTSSFSFAASKEYLALGEGLTAEEMTTVLGLLGVDDISDYDVLYVTLDDEKQYLSSYVSAAQIGDRSLSSVLIKETLGNKIKVETHNINYCTPEMYQNALATAGVEGADVVVAGPFEISGTAALVGTIKLYEQMTGEEVSDEVIEGAVGEMTTTGDLAESIGDDEAAGLMSEIKDRLADNPDMSEAELEQLIRDVASEMGISLSEDNIQAIKSALKRLQGMDIDWDNVKSHSLDIFGKIKDVANSEEAQGIFQKLVAWVKSLIG